MKIRIITNKDAQRWNDAKLYVIPVGRNPRYFIRADPDYHAPKQFCCKEISDFIIKINTANTLGQRPRWRRGEWGGVTFRILNDTSNSTRWDVGQQLFHSKTAIIRLFEAIPPNVKAMLTARIIPHYDFYFPHHSDNAVKEE